MVVSLIVCGALINTPRQFVVRRRIKKFEGHCLWYDVSKRFVVLRRVDIQCAAVDLFPIRI